ncbi:MAG: hypothetical protein ACJAVR_002647 [Paracoccaceae bacterium]|jgi:hypothetical protein
MKRLLSIAAAAALAASPAFAQNVPAAGASTGGGVAQSLTGIGGSDVPVEVVVGLGALVIILLVAGSGGSDSTSTSTTTPPS